MIAHITRITYFMNIPKELHNYLVHTQELRQNTKGGKGGRVTCPSAESNYPLDVLFEARFERREEREKKKTILYKLKTITRARGKTVLNIHITIILFQLK